MKKNRILSYGLSKKISDNDISSISGAAGSHLTQHATDYFTGDTKVVDVVMDISLDM